jgi:hypothetical protein
MSLTIHIKGWKTIPEGECPCDTCEHATVIKGAGLKQVMRVCSILGRGKELPFEPVFCDGWTRRGELPLYKLEQLSWNLLEDKRGNLIGFRSPSKTRELVADGKAERPDSVDPDF